MCLYLIEVEGLKVCVSVSICVSCLSVCLCVLSYLSVCLSERLLNKLLGFIVISVCPQYTVYGIVCHISHLCVNVLDVVTMWLEERFINVYQDFYIVDDHPKQSLQE